MFTFVLRMLAWSRLGGAFIGAAVGAVLVGAVAQYEIAALNAAISVAGDHRRDAEKMMAANMRRHAAASQATRLALQQELQIAQPTLRDLHNELAKFVEKQAEQDQQIRRLLDLRQEQIQAHERKTMAAAHAIVDMEQRIQDRVIPQLDATEAEGDVQTAGF